MSLWTSSGRPPVSRGPNNPSGVRGIRPAKTGGIASRIKRLRIHFKWTQDTLAGLVGVPQQAVSAWERALWKPTGPAIFQLAQVFGVSPEALSKGKEFKLPDQPPRWGVAVDERDPNRQVPLPPPVPGGIWEISLSTNDRQALPLEEAITLLRKAAKEGQAVWVVVEK